jgi:hypothetical protein
MTNNHFVVYTNCVHYITLVMFKLEQIAGRMLSSHRRRVPVLPAHSVLIGCWGGFLRPDSSMNDETCIVSLHTEHQVNVAK